MSTTTNLDKLKINYLTQEQYEDAVENEEINENELYFTPGHNNDAIVPVELTQAAYDALTTEQKNNGMVYCVSDANGTYLTASEVSYGSSSVQDALDSLGFESGTGYCKLPDGTLIQWGRGVISDSENTMQYISTAGVYWYTLYITLPYEFINEYYVANGSTRYSTSIIHSMGMYPVGRQQMMCTVYDYFNRPLNDNAYRYSWCAIGRWK